MSINGIYFSEVHEDFRQFLRALFAKKIIPYIDDWEKNRQVPRDIWQVFGAHGLLGLFYSKENNGEEKDIFYSVIFLEELGRLGYIGARVAIAVHVYMANSYLALAGSDALKEKYLTPAIKGEKIAALAITEEQAGSDLGQLQTTVMVDPRHPDYLVVNGKKKFVANGTIADFIVLAAKTIYPDTSLKPGSTGLSLIVVDMQSIGISRNKLDMLGWYAGDIAQIEFKDVKIPRVNLIGSINKGFFYIMQCMQLERLSAGILAIGGIEDCLVKTWSYLSKRKIFGSALSQFQTISHKMAHFSTELAAIKQLAYHTAWLYEQKKLPITECSMVKLKATELARQVSQECLQFCGAFGYQTDQALSRIYRDTQGATIAGGASEIMLDIIAQSVFDESSFLFPGYAVD